MTQNAPQTMQSSNDPAEVVQAALLLARDVEPDGHKTLAAGLQSLKFLDRLDSDEEYLDLGGIVRVNRIVEALAENRTGSAHDVLVELTESKTFLVESRRTDFLIAAVAVIKPSPPDVIRFWDAYCKPLDGFTPLSIQAMVTNGSDPAIELLERKMLDPKHDDMDKIDWMRYMILPHRHDLPLLNCCERLLKGALPDSLRMPLVEALFDYRPEEWYGDDDIEEPPPAAARSRESLLVRKSIGALALNTVEMSDELKKIVEQEIESTTQDSSKP